MLGDLLSAVITGDGGVTPPIASEIFWVEGAGLPGNPPECVTVMRYCPAAGAAIETRSTLFRLSTPRVAAAERTAAVLFVRSGFRIQGR